MSQDDIRECFRSLLRSNLVFARRSLDAIAAQRCGYAGPSSVVDNIPQGKPSSAGCQRRVTTDSPFDPTAEMLSNSLQGAGKWADA